jgi:hypothetical protein
MLTRRNEWDQLDPAQADPLCLKSITELFDKFKYSLQLPEHFAEYRAMLETDAHTSDPSVSDSELTKDQEIAELRKTIARLNQQIGDIHLDYAKKEQEKDRKYHVIWNRLRQRVAKLAR